MKLILGFILAVAIIQHPSLCHANEALDLITTDISVDVEDNTTDTNITTTTSAPLTTTTPTKQGGQWHHNYTSGHYCILLEATSMFLEITYPTEHGNTSVITVGVPGESSAVAIYSKCGFNLSNDELNETLAISSPDALKLTLVFHFTRDPYFTGDKTMDKSQLLKIGVMYLYDPAIFPDLQHDKIHQGGGPGGDPNMTLREFVVMKDRSYQCNSASKIVLDANHTLKFTGVRAQAFMANDRFSSPEPCPADQQSSDLVPIIIGAVLAAIVLIVLIAYLIGRAKMRRTTYESI